MLEQFEQDRRSKELSKETLEQEVPHKAAIEKVKALFIDTFTKTVNALAEQKVLNLLFSNMFQTDFVWTKYHYIDVEYDAVQKQYLVSIAFSKVHIDKDSTIQQKVMTEEQILSLAKAYDLGLHLGAHVKFPEAERAERKYLLFNSPEDLTNAAKALDSWCEVKCYRKSNYPNCMEIYSEIQKLLEGCHSQTQMGEKPSPRK